MISTANHWKLGLFIVAGLAVTFGTAAWIGIDQLRRDFAVWYAYFDEPVDGLDVGSAVKFLGVPIGEVVEIGGGPPPHVNYVKVTAWLYLDSLESMGMYDPAAPLAVEELLPPNLRVQLISSPLTGVTFIQALFSDTPRQRLPFPTDVRTVPSMPSKLETLSRGLGDTLDRMPQLAEAATRLLEDMDVALLELDMPTLSRRLHDLLATAEAKIDGVDTLALSDEARGALQGVRDLVADLRGDQGAVNRTVGQLERVVGLLDRALAGADLPATTDSFRGAGDSMAQAGAEFAALGRDLRSDVGLLRDTLESVRRLADLLERDPGSLLYGRSPRTPVRRER